MTTSKLISLLLVLFMIPAFACSSPEDSGDERVTGETEITRESGEQAKEEEMEQPDKAEEHMEKSDESDEEDGDDTSEKDDTDEEESDELDEELVEKGEKLYKEKACASCHTFGKGRLVGPDLQGVTERREEEWLKKWIKNPDEMLRTDPIAKEMLKEYMVPMPNQGLNDEEVDAVVEYIKHMDKK